MGENGVLLNSYKKTIYSCLNRQHDLRQANKESIGKECLFLKTKCIQKVRNDKRAGSPWEIS